MPDDFKLSNEYLSSENKFNEKLNIQSSTNKIINEITDFTSYSKFSDLYNNKNEDINLLYIQNKNDLIDINDDKKYKNKNINFQSERIFNFSFNSISKNSEKYRILRFAKEEIHRNIIKIISESKEYAIFFLSNSQENKKIKEKIKFYEGELKINFNLFNLYEIFKIFIGIIENADTKFKDYLFKCDENGYNLIHYFSALGKLIEIIIF